jgi:copper chaperone NosL
VNRREFLSLLALAVLTGACTPRAAPGPPNIRYGRDVCAECGMVISDGRFAAAASAAGDAPVLFDDIGCLVTYRQKRRPGWTAVWVHDYETCNWLRAETAWFLLSSEVRSPMGWGLAAFGDRGRARARQADLGGEVLSWAELETRPLTPPRRG